MATYDALLNFGSVDFSATNLGAASTTLVSFPDVIDVGTDRDIFKGGPLLIEIEITTIGDTDYSVFQAVAGLMTDASSTAGVAALAGTLDVLSKSGEYIVPGATTTVHTGNFGLIEVAAGDKIYLALPPLPRTETPVRQYLSVMLQTTLASSAVAVGTMTARLVPWGSVQLDAYHGSGFSVG